MSNYYLDIETTGFYPEKDKIITIQFQRLDSSTGKPVGELTILKEWESSEKEIIQQFIVMTEILDSYPFSFVPVGFNLAFEHKFLSAKAKEYNLPNLDIMTIPFIDLKAVTILMNKGNFKGCGLDAMTGKKSNGSMIPEYYRTGNFQAIVNYVENETTEFLKFHTWLLSNMPIFHSQFKAQQ